MEDEGEAVRAGVRSSETWGQPDDAEKRTTGERNRRHQTAESHVWYADGKYEERTR